MKLEMAFAGAAGGKLESLTPLPASSTQISAEDDPVRLAVEESKPCDSFPGVSDVGVKRNSRDLESLLETEGSRRSALPMPCQRLHTVDGFTGRDGGISSRTRRCRVFAVAPFDEREC